MKFQRNLIRLILVLVTVTIFFEARAQSYIKVYGQKVNYLDKQKRKQGDWIFFDNNGFVQMTCVFQNDVCISPIVFYENSDTVFIKYPVEDSLEVFELFEGDKRYRGHCIYSTDTTKTVKIESENTLNDSLILKIKKYQKLIIEPNYYFSQKKLIEYLSASFSSSNIIFNKELKVLLSISSSGIVTKVEFPGIKTYLSSNEESELNWIFSTMPRWQPLFYKNKTVPVKIMLTNNSTLSVLSFDH